MASESRKIMPADVPSENEAVFDPENPEWTEEDFARERPTDENPEFADLTALVRKGGRPLLPDAPRKGRVIIMLDPDVIGHSRPAAAAGRPASTPPCARRAGLED